MTASLVIRGGKVFDGTGAAATQADVVIKAGRIAEIGTVGDIDAIQIDATECYVAPGFIDIHSHSDYTLLVDPRALSSIYQGVTLEVVGNCGFGCFPIGNPATAATSIYGYRDDLPISWRSAVEYFEQLEATQLAVNLLSLVPNAQLRMSVMDSPSDVATSSDIVSMKRLLEESLEAGAWGFSTGLEYAVEERASEEEIVALCGAVARVGGLYATHTRGRSGDGIAGVAEGIRTAEKAGARLQISHLLPRGGQLAGERCLALVDSARARNVDVAFDQHTRPHAFTYLHVALPPEAMDGGPVEIALRLRDPNERALMRQYRGLLGDEWSRVVLLDSPRWPEYAQRDFASIAAERSQDPFDAVLDVLLGSVDELHQLMVIMPCYSERQQRETFAHPLCIPASDATALAPDGPLRDSVFHGAYTWAAWYWRAMVREQRVLTPAEAIRRLTSMPADVLGVRDRGRLKAGACADVVVFDPDRFADRGTLVDPNKLADGMQHVIVNGVVTLRDGVATGARAGQVLRRA
jgi:N-acyl-D-aspartate/D-glutamate deacylase